jgi:hypothetical protein
MTTQPLSALTMLLSRHTKRREIISLLNCVLAGRERVRALPTDALQVEQVPDVNRLALEQANPPFSMTKLAI